MRKTIRLNFLITALCILSMLLCACGEFSVHILEKSTPDGGFIPAVKLEAVNSSSAKIFLSEMMIHNNSSVTSEDGKRSSWIEICNRSNEACELSAYSLSYGGKDWTLPQKSLAGGEYMLVFASDCEDGAEFSFADEGTITLKYRRTAVEEYVYSNPTPDYSYNFLLGREISNPTPGYYEAIAKDKIEISEVMSKNLSYIINGTLCDWVELYNAGESDVDLSLFFISDKQNLPFAFRLGKKILSPGEYCLVECNESVDLSLSEEGDSVYLTRADGVLCASLTVPKLTPNNSYASGEECDYPTPGYANTKENHALFEKTPSSLVINEVVSSNSSVKKAGDGKYYDVIELYNNTTHEINLGDYYLSDKRSNPLLWNLPSQNLKSGEYYIVYAADKTSDKYPNFAPFSLSSDGEALFLSNKDGSFVDAINIPYLPCDVSYGRSADSLLYFATPTIGKANSKSGRSALSGKIVASVASGVYNEAKSVVLSNDDGGKIYYTLDSSKPSATNGVLYSGEAIEVSSSCTIRAINIKDDLIPSSVYTFNYLLDIPRYSLGIINITTDKSEFDNMYASFLKNIEIEANVAYYENGNEEFNVNCGLKLSGRSSLYFEKKSFLLHFRAKYGASKLKFDIFDDPTISEYNTLVIRSGSAGALRSRAFLNDEFVTSIVKDSDYTNLLVQDCKPVDVYVNGKYYGIYYIREKVNQSFVASHDNVDKESVSVVETMDFLLSGSSWQGFKELWSFICEKDLTLKENYDYVAQNFDLESVADFYIFQAWCANVDSTNVRMYKSSASDGKWRMLLYDLDMSFGNHSSEYGKGTVKSMLENPTTKSVNGMGSYNIMIVKLLKNDEFRALFFSRLAHLCENELSTQNVLTKFNAMCDEIQNDMQYNVAVWTNTTKLQYHTSVEQWVKSCDNVRKYWLCDEHLDTMVNEFITVCELSEEEILSYMGEKYVK